MSELLREIEEDLRNERLQKLWQRFGKVMVGVSVSVVVVTIAYVIWQDQHFAKQTSLTARLMKGAEQSNAGQYKEAIAAFEALANDTSGDYRTIVLLHKAKAEKLANHVDTAGKTYSQVISEGKGNFDNPYIALASVLAANDKDTATAPQQGTAFYYTRSEWHGWQLVTAGKATEAKTVFSALAQNMEAPSSLRERASLVSAHLDTIKDAGHETGK